MSTSSASDSRLRRMAARQGFALCKSRAALSVDNCGGYMIVDPNTNSVVAGEKFDMFAGDVLAFLEDE